MLDITDLLKVFNQLTYKKENVESVNCWKKLRW
jgi:hypothetical protein